MSASKLGTLEQTGKRSYVAAMRVLRVAALKTGLLSWLKGKSSESRTAHWVRSLFYIHDIDGLLDLDVPWWTYEAIEEVEQFLSERPEARVFEFGSGASTIWLGHRAKEVKSVEHDAGWYPIVQERLKDGNFSKVTHTLIAPEPKSEGMEETYLSSKPGHEGLDFTRYATSILDEEGLFDLIVVDGRAREACLLHASEKLAPGGMVVFDNSGRQRYAAGIANSALKAVRYPGLAPSLPYRDETTLLRAPDK